MPQLAQMPLLSVADYLAGEDGAEVRHEYIAGQVYAMSGASRSHGLIALNIATFLRPRLRGTGCQLFASGMKVRLRIQGDDIFYYPDLLLSCDPADRATYYCTAPCLLVEVLSESTAALDRREKFWAYRTLPSLREYLLVAQDRTWARIHRRDRDWAPEIVESGAVRLDCLDCELPLDVVYEDLALG